MAQTDTDIQDNTGQADVSDDGSLEPEELKKSYDGISIHQYINSFDDDQYFTSISKDAYHFLSGREDEVVDLLMVGRDVADEFKTLNYDQVRQVYVIIIDTLVNGKINVSKMTDELLRTYPFLKRYEAQRIIKTELTRVIFYAREEEAKREGMENYYYGWMGPLDYRTTPMCYYLQTGQLRDSDRKALYKAGHTESDLPTIPEEGLLLDDLKQACKQVAWAFGHDMISDWEMHINCRHTFARGNRALEPTESTDGLADIFQQLQDLPDDQLPEIIEEPEDNDSKVNYFRLNDGYDSYVFNQSIFSMPTMYDGGTDTIYVFDIEDELSILTTAEMTHDMIDLGVDLSRIVFAIQDQLGMSDEDIGYIIGHYQEIIDRLTPYVY